MPDAVKLEGFDELDRGLRRLPATMAQELQGTLVRQLIEAKREIAASSTMSARGKQALRARLGIVRILPDRIVRPRRLVDVVAELYAKWRGGELPKEEAAARAIEAEVGKSHYTPKRRRGLLVPAGILRTKGGGIKKRGGKALDPAKLPNTRWVRNARGGVLLVQDKGGRRARSNIVGILLPRTRITARMPFFGSWARLASRRTSQYGRLLDKIVRRF